MPRAERGVGVGVGGVDVGVWMWMISEETCACM